MRTLIGLPLAGSVPEVARLRDFLAAHRGFGVIDEIDERLPEFLEQRHPFLLAGRDRVERVLHLCGEVVVDVGREILRQEPADDLADVRRGEAPAFDFDVFPVAQRRNDRCVRRRAADAVLLQRFDQRGFGKARRRLGEMLGRSDADQLDAIALLHRRQHVIRVVLNDVVHAFLIHRDISGFDQGRAVGAQHRTLRPIRAGQQFDRHGVEDRRRHLAGDGALPDQRVQTELIRFDLLFDVGGQNARRGRADRLVRFLGVLRLGAIDPRLLRESLLPVQLHDDFANLADGFLREIERVRAHVGDEADGALADVDAFVQLLRNAHGLLRAEAELARGFLLQGRGRERRRRIAAALLAVDPQYGEFALGGALEACAPPRVLAVPR